MLTATFHPVSLTCIVRMPMGPPGVPADGEGANALLHIADWQGAICASLVHGRRGRDMQGGGHRQGQVGWLKGHQLQV